jgi:hypothetical protein
VLEWIELSPAEHSADPSNSEGDRSFAWRRIAAKEAVRRLWLARGHAPVFPADLEVQNGPDGRARLRSLHDPEGVGLPVVATAYAEGVAVAIASLDPEAWLGIGVERLSHPDDHEARIRCCRTAAGMGSVGDAAEYDESTGELTLRDNGGRLVRCMTARRGDYVWAWTAYERTER